MREAILRDFFTGGASIEDLVRDLQGAIISDGSCVARYPIVDMGGEFTVQSSHLIRICDAFADGHLKPDDLRSIGFCLIASDAFEWDADTPDGERVALRRDDDGPHVGVF